MKGQIVVLDRSGDSKLGWDTDIPASVKEAERFFNGLKANGHMLYRDGDSPAVLHNFDPNEQNIIAHARIVGG